MRKVFSAILILIGILTFSACDSDSEVISRNKTKSMSEFLLLTIDNKESFITENNTETLLGNYRIPNITDDYNFIPSKYTFVDLDSNGTDELVLSETKQNFVLVLRFNKEDEKIYGYSLNTRSFIDVKTNGTFMQSDGAGINSISKITFDNTKLIITEIAVKNDSENIFKINNQSVTKENVDKYFTEWQTIEHSVWKTIDS